MTLRKQKQNSPLHTPGSHFAFHPRWPVSQVLEPHRLTSVLSLPSPQKEPSVWCPVTSAGLGSPCHCEIADKRFAEFPIATRSENPGGDPRWGSSQSSLSNLGVTPAAWVLLAAARVSFLYPEKSGIQSDGWPGCGINSIQKAAKQYLRKARNKHRNQMARGLIPFMPHTVYHLEQAQNCSDPPYFGSCRMTTIHFRWWSLA